MRPGPITGDMVHPYLRRRRGEEPVEYPHESLQPVLEKTLGVPLFQEQVMQLAMVAADYTPGEADQLRRDMAAWRRSGRIEKHHERLVSAHDRARASPTSSPSACSSRSAASASTASPRATPPASRCIAYVTAWLRCHHPTEFTCALLNAQPMGFYTPATHRRAMPGVTASRYAPSTCASSGWDCTLEPLDEADGHAIRMGLRYVKSLRREASARIVTERQAAPFRSIDDFVRRTQIDEGSQTRLAEAGALAAFHANRRDALWQVRGFHRAKADSLPLPQTGPTPDFAPLDALEEVIWDHETSFHSTRGHPLEPLRAVLRAQNLPDARTIQHMRDGQRVRYAGMVICRQRPGTASGVTFMTLEDETGFVNAVLWQRVWETYGPMAKTTAFLGITGQLQVEEGLIHLIADSLWLPRLDRDQGPHAPPSRDFR